MQGAAAGEHDLRPGRRVRGQEEDPQGEGGRRRGHRIRIIKTRPTFYMSWICKGAQHRDLLPVNSGGGVPGAAPSECQGC